MRESDPFIAPATRAPAPLTLTCDDGFELAATAYPAAGAARAVVVVAGALGVPRGFYGRLAEFLSAQGVAALTFDYRGAAECPPAPGQEALIDMERWGRLDIEAALLSASALYPDAPVFLVGHSCGGQLFGLAASSPRLAGAVLVAASLPHRSRYPWPSSSQLWLAWRWLIPLRTRGGGHRPAGIPGLAGAMAPRAVLRQWAQWCRSRHYLFDPRFGLDVSRYAELELPLLAITISDDPLAPPAAVQALAERFPRARIERRTIDTRHLGYGSIGHMGFFRSKHRDALWFPLLNWIVQRRPAAAVAPGAPPA